MATDSGEAIRQQYQSFQSGAGVVALPGRTLIEISGEDRVGFINSFCTNDVKRLQPGQGCEAFFTNHQGKAAGHGLIFAHDNALVVETTADQASGLIAHLDRFVISERVTFRDRSREWAEFFVGGANAPGLPGLEGDALPHQMLTHRPLAVGGVPTIARRVGMTASPGWLLQVEASQAPALQDALLAKGAMAASGAAFDICRLEAGWPMYGIDITADNLPQEIDRNEQAISFKKGCYLGQETVARLDALGHVNRLLVLLTVASAAVPPPGARVFQGEKDVGQITSAGWSPGFGTPLALALVRRSAAPVGTSLRVETATAQIVKPLPTR